jgi:three-Cys-motif partner protein
LPEKSKEPFLQRQLRKIIVDEKQYQQIIQIKQGVYNDVKSWSSLKLIFLKYVSDVYSGIMKSNKFFSDKYYYVDLFSGSGIGKVIDNKKDLIFGSPLIVAKHEFVKMFFCDCNERYCEALEERLKAVGLTDEKFSVYNKDCNDAIDDIIPQIKVGHSLIFIDPYGMDIEWKTMEKILGLNADIIMNFQTRGGARGVVQDNKLTPTAEKFFKSKDEAEKILKTAIYEGSKGDRLLNLYIKDIMDTRTKIDSASHRKTIVENVRIKKDEKFYYDLIFIVRTTGGGNPWLTPIVEAGQELETLDSKIVQQILDVLKGRQKTLFASFMKFLPLTKYRQAE